ncbi:MAG: hypothetical protein IJN95_04085 [Clostridia bacterium]|nr:hypothetical protein [Clostridia bacterium]
MAEKIYCNQCTDKGHCPEYRADSVCVNERTVSIVYKIRDNDYFRALLAKQGVVGKEADEILQGFDDLNVDYTLYGRPGCFPDRYELRTVDGEKLNINEQNGYVRGVVLVACDHHFRTGTGAEEIHGTFEVVNE